MNDVALPLFGLLAAGGIAVAVGMVVAHGVRQARARSEAALRLGIERETAGLLRPETLRGTVGGVPLTITFLQRKNSVRTEFQVGGDLPRAITVRPQPKNPLSRLVAGDDLETGDRAFDAVVHVSGDARTARALLQAPLRAELARLVITHGAVLDGGTLAVSSTSLGVASADEIEAVARELVRAAQAIAAAQAAGDAPGSPLGRLAREDPDPGVRAAVLRALVESAPRDPVTRETAEAMPPFRDPEDEMLRVQTCGDAVARPLLEDLARENLPFELRGVALATLVERFGYPENAAVVVEGLGARTTTDRVAAARLIARHRDTTQTARLGQLMLREPEEAGAIGFATALGELGDPAAEDDLLTLLARPSDVTQLAAATALGRLGTVRAVEPLLPLTEGLFRDGALRDAAREAVRRIQARLGAVEEGRVSLAPDAAGRLSVVRAEPGAVTLAETKAQR
jgi:hypothetical protein